MKTSVLVLGRRPQAIPVVRSLTKAGYRVVVGQNDLKPSPASFSKIAREIWELPEETDEDAFDAAISKIAEQRSVDVIFPTSEAETAYFARKPGLVSPPTTVAMPRAEIAALCSDKSRMGELVNSIGIPYAAAVTVGNRQELINAAERVGYPCVVKPSNISDNRKTRFVLHKKAIICRSREYLESMFPIWPEDQQNLLVQRFVGGMRQNLSFAAEHGRIVRISQLEILRTNEFDGTGLMAEGRTVPLDPSLFGYCQALADHLDYTGVGCAQFLTSDSGDVTFLELNPRLDANHAIVDYCGHDLAVLAVQLARQERPEPINDVASYRIGVRMASSMWDFQRFSRAIKKRSIAPGQAVQWAWRIAVTFLRADIHIFWNWRDPGPGLFTLANTYTRFAFLKPALAKRFMAPKSMRRVGQAAKAAAEASGVSN